MTTSIFKCTNCGTEIGPYTVRPGQSTEVQKCTHCPKEKGEIMELFYPEAENWMWDYCIPLGQYTDPKGMKYDLGIYPGRTPGSEPSHAIVYGNEPGDYISGEISLGSRLAPCRENVNRWITFQLDHL